MIFKFSLTNNNKGEIMKKLVQLSLVFAFIIISSFNLNTPVNASTDVFRIGVNSGSFTGSDAAYIPFINNYSAFFTQARNLLWGYSLYDVNLTGETILDRTVVKSLTTSTLSSGNKVYSFELNNNLKWSDGMPVTAKDYIFSILFFASKAWSDSGNYSSQGDGLIGYEDYFSGSSSAFSGIQLTDTYKFSLTLSSEYTPYFYETQYLTILPVPMHHWAKNLTLDSKGQSLIGDLTSVIKFVTETEAYKPTVISGPYKISSTSSSSINFSINSNYQGNYLGEKPSINSVSTIITNYDEVDRLLNGELDLLTGIIDSWGISQIRSRSDFNLSSYYRNGFGLIAFHTDFGPTKFTEVRQALAYLIDRNVFISQILNGNGTIVNGEYGLGQWMYQLKKDQIEEELTNYTFNVQKANELLDMTPYKFEADGVTPFDPAKAAEGYWRHTAIGEILHINHLGTTSNVITALIANEWPKGLNRAGIKFTWEEHDFNTLLSHYYYAYELDPSERRFHTFNLATNFSPAYDPYYSMHSDWLGTWQNANQLNDPQIDYLTETMRALNPTEKARYAELWLDYQIRWNELLPNLPTYTNEYFDAINNKYTGYQSSPFVSWGKAIVRVTMEPRFSDVPFDFRAYQHIEYLASRGIINGYSDGTFKPNANITRAQAAIMIVRAIGLDTGGASSMFTDVPQTHSAYKFISAANQAGIINGYSDGTFKPNAYLTRAQIAIMVQRAFSVQASGTNITFSDVPEGYAPKKFIEILASQKIVNGYSDGTFKPLNNVTRAQFSIMMYNAIKYSESNLP
jgi:peptide/nickel transport system substrate-binding protein